jgi:hypothetical protein
MVEVFNLIAHQGGYLAQALVTRADGDFGKGSQVSLTDETGQIRPFWVQRMGLATSGIQGDDRLLVDLELIPFNPSSLPSPNNED